MAGSPRSVWQGRRLAAGVLALSAALGLGATAVRAQDEPTPPQSTPLESTQPGGLAPPLTLEGAVALATRANLHLATADARLDAASARALEARGLRLPRLGFEASYVRTDNPVLVFGQKLLQGDFTLPDFDLENLNHPDALDDWAARLVVEQPIWSGGRLAGASQAASSAAEAAIAERERARQEVVREVTDRYTAVVLADYGQAAALESLETARANVRVVRDLYETGLVVESDLLLALVRESEVEELVVRAEAALEVAKAALNSSLGRDQRTPFRLPETLDRVEPVDADIASLLTRAFDRRPDLSAARLYGEASQGELRRARGGRRPDLGLQASVETHGADFFGNDGDNATVMVGMRVPLFAGKSLRARVEEAEARSREAQLHVERLEDRVELEIRERLAELRAADRRLSLALRGLELARRSLDIVEDRYRNGLTTLVDLLEAESAMTESRVREVSARRDLVLARAGLDLATGDL